MKVKKVICSFLITAICAMALSGCGSKKNEIAASDVDGAAIGQVETPADTAGTDEAAASQDTVPADAKDTAKETAPAEAPKEELQWDTDTMKNETGKTLIKCIGENRDGNSHVSFGIISSKGTAILADPIYSTKDKGYIKADILTVTHSHSDHYNQKLQTKMKDYMKLSYFTPESFTVEDVNVTGVAASHSSLTINDKRPSNVIYVYELDGLRIAHMGDMGQDELTADQLEKLGQLDIIFTIITNAPTYGSATEKNIKIIQQLNPKIVIPTHYAEDVLSETIKALGVKEVERTSDLAISKDDLKDASMRFIIVE